MKLTQRNISNNWKTRLSAVFIAVTVVFSGIPMSVFAAPVADIKINGQDGTVTIVDGETWSFSWSSNNATVCNLKSPYGTTGISLAGNDGPVEKGDDWYPAIGGSTTLTFECTDGTDSHTDTATVKVVAGNTGGGGGGGGGGNTPASVNADIKINGNDGTTTITQGQTWSFSWVADNATACNLKSPYGTTGISLAGNDGPVTTSDEWYPAVGGSTTLTLECTNGTSTDTDSATVRVVASSTGGGSSNNVLADIKINGQDGTVTIVDGETWSFSWSSNNATVCNLKSPYGTTGISLAGNDGPVEKGDDWYPAIGGSTTLTLECTNGTDTDTDSATIRVVARSTGGGGGGGGSSSGGGGGSSYNPPAVNPPAFCPYITQYMRMGQANDTLQVIRLQAFLKNFEGFQNVTLTGVYDQATVQAVNAFQQRYSAEILAPWGINYSTGYVYLTTSKKINQIMCGPQAPVVVPTYTQAPAPTPDCPIDTTVPSKTGSSKTGYSKEGGFGTTDGVPVVGTSGGSGPTSPNIDLDKGQNITDNKYLAAVFTGPANFGDLMQCIWEFILILVVLYILASVLENVLYEDRVENVRKKFFTKWITIAVGLVVAIIVASMIGEYCLVLPIFIALVASLVWMFFYPKHDEIKTRTTSWQTSISEKTKRLLEETKESIEDDEKKS